MDDAAFDDHLIRDRWQDGEDDDEYVSTSSASIPIDDEPPARAPVKKRTDKEINDDLKKTRNKLEKLDKLFLQAHKKKASNKTISDIEQFMSSERRKLASLEDELLTEDEEVRQRADKLEQDIAQLNDEIANLTIKVELKTDELRVLRPYSAGDDTQNSTSVVGQDEDDHERVWLRMEDRRKRYIEMYGIDPSAGSIVR